MLNLADATLSSCPPDDYDVIRAVIAFISRNWRAHPAIAEIAAHVHLSETELHVVFKRWAGLTPKAFLQAVTLDHAKRLIRDTSVLEASYELGLSGPGRLHDLFVTHEALSPGEYKMGGAGLVMSYGFAPSPFGEAIGVLTPRGLAGLGFVDGDRAVALEDMKRRWPRAVFQQNDAELAPVLSRVFDPLLRNPSAPLRLVMIGTDFEVRVWQALLNIPMGQVTTYGALANRLNKPKAARAVGAAVGRNPISFVVPCHRVIGSSGKLTGYHWGLPRKQAMLGWETGKV